MRVVYEKAAAKALEKMPPHKRDAVLRGMERVAQDPFGQDNAVQRLRGWEDLRFRKRFGDIRALYIVDVQGQEVRVFRVGSRGSVYREH